MLLTLHININNFPYQCGWIHEVPAMQFSIGDGRKDEDGDEGGFLGGLGNLLGGD